MSAARPAARPLRAAALLCAAAVCGAPAPAQDDLPAFLSGGMKGGLADSFGLNPTAKPTVGVSAAFTDAAGDPLAAGDAVGPGDELTLAVTATIPEGFALVSQTSPAGLAATLKLSETARLEPVESPAGGPAFRPGRAPKSAYEAVYEDVVEKFAGTVTWTRRFRVLPGDGPVRAAGDLSGSYCSTGAGGVCVNIGRGEGAFEATVGEAGGAAEANEPAGPFAFESTPAVRGKPGPVAVRAELPRGAAVGEAVTAAVTLSVDDGFHVYALGDAGPNAIPTSFTTSPVGLEPAGDWAATTAPEEHEKAGDVLREHHGAVTFEAPFTVTDADYGLAGAVTYQVCTDKICLRPKAVPFTVGAARAVPGAVPGTPAAPASVAAAGGVELSEEFAAANENPLAAWGLWAVFPAAFLAGLALNVMPCVLPVIAIKVMSFVQQAGESRAAILKLNLWYTLGVLAVFMTFAGLSLGLGTLFGGESDFTWGDHLNGPWFKIGMTALVFAMALSMLGVYEIPVPGFVGSAAGSSAGQKEGGTGAFLSGVFTTLLATPCTGPLMVPVLAFAAKLAETSPAASAGVWAAMGVGFASPYLVFGLIPGASRYLPKPGMWMVRFKEFGGLVLIATSLWLMSGLDYSLWLPVLVGLLGLATGLWALGSLIAHNDAASRKWIVRGLAAGTVGCGAWLAASLTPEAAVGGEVAEADGWEAFSVDRLNELRAAGETVMVEFTSAVCVNCRVNEKVALDTAKAHAAYERLEVVPMKAWTDKNPDADAWLTKTGGYGVPHTVIFPGGRPNDPIVIAGLMTQGDLLDALEKASADAPVRTAAR